jgi:hypothetical protein
MKTVYFLNENQPIELRLGLYDKIVCYRADFNAEGKLISLEKGRVYDNTFIPDMSVICNQEITN